MTYIKQPFTITKTNHLVIKAEINGIDGNFIIDTGSGKTVANKASIDRFNLNVGLSNASAVGAGSSPADIMLSEGNHISINAWDSKNFGVAVMDMSEINFAFIENGLEGVHGIIGSDLLLEGKAFINYHERCLYLQK